MQAPVETPGAQSTSVTSEVASVSSSEGNVQSIFTELVEHSSNLAASHKKLTSTYLILY